MSELEVRHLRALCAVADTGSAERAAAQLGQTRAALIAQLQRVERIAGTPLFQRGRNGLRLTDYGRLVVDAARGVLAGLDHLHAITSRSTEPGGRVLRVGGVQGRLTTSWVHRLHQELPGWGLRGHLGLPVLTLLRMVAQGQLDTALVVEQVGYGLSWPEGVRHRLLVPFEPTCVALAEHHPLAGRGPEVRLADLADEWWILRTPDEGGSHAVLMAACAAAGFTPRVRYYVDDPVAQAHLVQAGEGVSPVLALSREAPGLTIRTLAGDPLLVRRFLTWRADLEDGHPTPRGQSLPVERLFQVAVEAYLELTNNNSAFARWFAAHPEVHPPVDTPPDDTAGGPAAPAQPVDDP
ncbi:MAG TPA: LysR family transcriptional regulator [Pseudonocardiaceae bacterium]